jgi:hypothetical protein
MIAAPSIVDVVRDPDLLGPYFEGPSWEPWRVAFKAIDALSLTEPEAELFNSIAQRDPPKEPVKEFAAVIGRGGGKDSAASAIAVRAAIKDYASVLRPGERATVLCIACDRNQARIILNYIMGYFRSVPLLQAMVARETQDGLELKNDVEIVVATNDYRAVRGRRIVCAIMDEAAFYAGDNAASSDREVYNALMPALARTPNSILIIISSPWKRSGLLYDKWAASYGKNDPHVLVVWGASLLFNSTLDPRPIEVALERDPEAARAEYLAQWRDDLTGFLDRQLVEAAVDRGVVVRAPVQGLRYQAFTDPSGGRGDSFTCGIAHLEAKAAILDCLFERRAPFDPSTVVADIAALLRGYGVSEVTGDRYSAQWVVEAFKKEGIGYRQSERDRSAIYLDCLPMFTSGMVRLIDSSRLIAQFVGLERRTFPTGKDRVDHGPSGSDDACNSAAGVLTLLVASDAPRLIRAADFLVDGAPVPTPQKCDAVFATLAVAESGEGATVYWSLTKLARPALVVLEFDVAAFDATLFPRVISRLIEYAKTAGARRGALGFFAADDLAGAGSRAFAFAIAPTRAQGLSREQMSLWFVGYPNAPGCDGPFG